MIRKVYIINKANHDFSAAERFGSLIVLSEGPMNRYAINNMCRIFTEKLEDSNPDDLIILCGLNAMNSIACSLFAVKHRRLNLLLFKDGDYIERNVVLDNQR